MSIFISHSSLDVKVAEEICALIENEGKKCFIAPRDINSGKEYAEELLNGIDNSESLILVLSQNANRSPHVLREVERAVSKSIPILVYKLEEVELTKSMEYFLMTHQWVVDHKKGDYSEVVDFVFHRNQSAQTGVLSDVKSQDRKKRFLKSKKKLLSVSAAIFASVAIVTGLAYVIHNVESSQNALANHISLGGEVVFGSYNGEPINWRVLHISEDKKEAVLISDDILTIKAYDAAESGTYNSDGTNDYWLQDTKADEDLDLQVQVRGNSDWSTSNIRNWLNSADEVVEYSDQPPMPLAMSEHKNGYHSEAGFLNAFSDEEQMAIVETTLETNGNGLAEGQKITTKDKVFLLSMDEMRWFDEAGMSYLAKPTAAAVDNDGSKWYELDVEQYGIKEYYWWLREPVEGTSSQCYIVCNGYTEQKFIEYNVGVEGFGIRPAITIDLEADIFN